MRLRRASGAIYRLCLEQNPDIASLIRATLALEQLHNECRWRNDLGALPLPAWGEGWGEGVTEPSGDLNPSPHPSPYGRGSRSSVLPAKRVGGVHGAAKRNLDSA